MKNNTELTNESYRAAAFNFYNTHNRLPNYLVVSQEQSSSAKDILETKQRAKGLSEYKEEDTKIQMIAVATTESEVKRHEILVKVDSSLNSGEWRLE